MKRQDIFLLLATITIIISIVIIKKKKTVNLLKYGSLTVGIVDEISGVDGSLYVDYYFRINDNTFKGSRTISYSNEIREGDKYLVVFNRGAPKNNTMSFVKAEQYKLGDNLDSLLKKVDLKIDWTKI